MIENQSITQIRNSLEIILSGHLSVFSETSFRRFLLNFLLFANIKAVPENIFISHSALSPAFRSECESKDEINYKIPSEEKSLSISRDESLRLL